MNNYSCNIFNDVEKCVDEAISEVGKNIVIFVPIAVGRSTIVVNEFYRRAKNDKSINLVLYSGLPLHTPSGKNELEKRIIAPIVERIYGNYPNQEYFRDGQMGCLPDNVEMREMYFPAGACIGKPDFQKTYVSSNYTHVARDVMACGCNVAVPMLAKRLIDGVAKYSLGSSADATVIAIKELNKKRMNGQKVAIIGHVNNEMPFMFGDGEIDEDSFTGIVDDKKYFHKMFSSTRETLGTTEYAIGLNASTLVKDGGTFQVGFGSLAESIIYSLQLRQERNREYREIIDKMDVVEKNESLIEEYGGLDKFDEGLYGCSEFIYDGFFDLVDSGIIKRNVYDSVQLQKLLSERRITEDVNRELLDTLIDEGIVSERFSKKDFEFLKEYGIFKESVNYENGKLSFDKMEGIPSGLMEEEYWNWIVSHCLGDRLKKGTMIHAGFFIGTSKLYERLLDMDDSVKRRTIKMRDIEFVNSVYKQYELKCYQRRDARFFNSGMIVTLLGAAASDTLENGQVVSGVGGQYEFVSMGHAVPDARSIMLIKSTRNKGDNVVSNILWNYGNVTIPRHLRDMVVTEYGIADLRSRSDRECIIEMIKIADSRFQNELIKIAIRNGKLEKEFCLSPEYRHNYPEVINEKLKQYRENGFFEAYPYGTDLTETELIIYKALRIAGKAMAAGKVITEPVENDYSAEKAEEYLERMKLQNPVNPEEQQMKKVLIYGLASIGAI